MPQSPKIQPQPEPSPGDQPNITAGSPESFGWQRRPDHDTPTGVAYERPDGQLQLFERAGQKPMLARLRPAQRSTTPMSWAGSTRTTPEARAYRGKGWA